MPKTVENQKWFCIHKPKYTSDFLQISNNEWMNVNKCSDLGPYALQLYLYLAANANNYEFALSPEAAEQAAGIRRTTFYKYLRALEEKGYVVWRRGNVFDFYTTPRPANERTQPDNHESMIFFDDDPPGGQPSATASAAVDILPFDPLEGYPVFARQTPSFVQQTATPPSEQPCSHDEPACSPSDIEIDNRYDIDNTETDITDNGTLRVPASAAEAASALIAKDEHVWHISAQALQERHEKAREETKRFRRL